MAGLSTIKSVSEIKIGSHVVVTNLHKHCIMHVELFEHASAETVRVETYWRDGTFQITPCSDDEVAALCEILEGGDEYELETDDFQRCEMLKTSESQPAEFSNECFSSQDDLCESGYDCVREYYIVFNGVKLHKGEQTMDIDLSNITKTMTQAEAIKEFYEPIGMADFHEDSFDRPGFWAVDVSFGEADSAIYLGETIEEISAEQLSFSEYGVNYDPMGENNGNTPFESIQKEDRLILCSHPESDPSEDCDIFIKIN